jgi:hypothetical protein
MAADETTALMPKVDKIAFVLNSTYTRLNGVIVMVMTTSINLIIAHFSIPADTIGLFSNARGSDYPLPMAIDMLIASFAVGFFCTGICSLFIRGDVRKGRVPPLPEEPFSALRGPWRVYTRFPYLRPLLLRMFVFGLIGVLLMMPWSLAIMGLCCAGGKCSMPGAEYRILKGFFAGLDAFLLYPAILLSAASTRYAFQGTEVAAGREAGGTYASLPDSPRGSRNGSVA